MARHKKSRLFYNFIWILILAALLTLPSLGITELSALALEQEARCGQAEHVHTEACYYRDMLICGKKAHSHSQNCYLVLLSDNDINWLLTTMLMQYSQFNRGAEGEFEGLLSDMEMDELETILKNTVPYFK